MIYLNVATNPFNIIYSGAYGFFCNVHDSIITDSALVFDRWDRALGFENTPIVQGIAYNDMLSDVPLLIPDHAKPNVAATYRYPLSLPDQFYWAKFFAEAVPTYPVMNIIKEEGGLTYYEAPFVKVFAPGTMLGHQYTVPDFTFIINHGSSNFTGYGTDPPEHALTNIGLRAHFKYPAMLLDPVPPGDRAFLEDFVFSGNTGDPFDSWIDLHNDEGTWRVAVDQEPFGYTILNLWTYGSNTVSGMKGHQSGTTVLTDVLRLTRKVPGYFGIGIGFNADHAVNHRRFLVKDLNTNTVLEDFQVTDFSAVSSNYFTIEVLSTTHLPAITLEHTPIYFSYTNAEDTDFASNTWKGLILHEAENSIIVKNVPNIGFMGDF
jgi:hypothetical protein